MVSPADDEFSAEVNGISLKVLELFNELELDVTACMAVLSVLIVSGAASVQMPKEVFLSTLGRLYDTRKAHEQMMRGSSSILQ